MKEIFSFNTPLSSTLMIYLFPCCCEQPESVHQTASNGKGLLLLLLFFFPLTAVLGCCLKKKRELVRVVGISMAYTQNI